MLNDDVGPEEMMIRRIMTIGSIAACHAGAFIAIYFGRFTKVPICGSDVALFIIPFFAAAAAYSTVFFRIINIHNLWARGFLVIITSLLCGVISTAIGMTIAFNQ